MGNSLRRMAKSDGAKESDPKQQMYQKVAKLLIEADDQTGLFIMTGAGMSVASGVPVFRRADGKMTDEFLKFLSDYNKARAQNGKQEAPDWFSFSVPEMFEKITEKEAWAYWFWRITRAQVDLGDDYDYLMRIVNKFGIDKTFIQTSNCDMLHAKAGAPENKIYEIHGSLGWVQCADYCNDDILPVSIIEQNIRDGTVPRCPKCSHCLRPNVMIFGDSKLNSGRLLRQRDEYTAHKRKYQKRIIIEIGAGTVIASIRQAARTLSLGVNPHIRINPDCKSEDASETFIPIPDTGGKALSEIWKLYNSMEKENLTIKGSTYETGIPSFSESEKIKMTDVL